MAEALDPDAPPTPEQLRDWCADARRWADDARRLNEVLAHLALRLPLPELFRARDELDGLAGRVADLAEAVARAGGAAGGPGGGGVTP